MGEQRGKVEGIFLANARGAMPHEVSTAVAYPGRGLEGDRHFDQPDACDITLIEAEALDTMAAEHNLDLRSGQSRRQVLVRGVNLADFVGRRFRVGEIECEGEERCEPCMDLVGLVHTQVVLKGLLHTGLRASILKGGKIRGGDPVELSPTSP